ncbi:hypothetical protein THAOC_21711, partial [Thalassiosira oceanica]
KKGTIRLNIVDDDGNPHIYEIPNAIYDPDSPFNILGIPFLGEFFAKPEDPHGYDPETTITSNSAESKFVWDHGKHVRHFEHPSSRLPELHLNTGFGYFYSFCNRIRNTYNDRVHYAFSTACTTACDEGGISAETLSDPVKRKHARYKLGTSVLFKPGNGNIPERVVYEGASADGKIHFIRHKNNERSTTASSNLSLFNQADLTNVPRSPMDYCQEVGKGISQEEAQRLACPRVLTPLQQELLSWHYRLYHLPFGKIFRMCELGYLPRRLLACKNHPPICVACQFGQAHRRPWRTKGKKSGEIRDRQKEKNAGDGTSVDQIVSAQPGLVPQMHGSLTRDRIWGATTFVDHVTDFVYVHLMKDFTLEATLHAKKAYEKILHLAGHKVKSYRADNGRFADKGFHQACDVLDQKLTFCAVGAHHQNGLIENRNKQLTLGARTLLLDGMRKWPQMIDTMFWPFALRAQADRMNKLHLDKDDKTPESKLYNVPLTDIPVKNFHPLFCPVYVLDHRLHNAGGAGPPKWEPRSRIGVYCGHSPFHAGNVALVFNPQSGLISPQYHVVFDDEFTTVPHMERGEVPPNWPELFKYSTELATDEEYQLANEWLLPEAHADVKKSTSDLIDTRGGGLESLVPKTPEGAQRAKITSPYDIVPDQDLMSQTENDVNPTASTSTGDANSTDPVEEPRSKRRKVSFRDVASVSPSDSAGSRVSECSRPNTSRASSFPHEADDSLLMPTRINLFEAGLRRSARLRELRKQDEENEATALTTKTTKSKQSFFGKQPIRKVINLIALLSSVSDYAILPHAPPPDATPFQRLAYRLEEANELVDGTINCFQHYAFSVKLDLNETFTYKGAQQQPDWGMFFKAMQKEIADHEERGHWTLVERTTMPKWAKTIQAIWSFKRKRYPDGRINKHKARLCAHGGMQQWGENYWETYSPVVNMISVKLLLVIAKLHGLDSKSIDFVLAFPQAELDVDIWMELPLGFAPEDDLDNGRKYVLKLNKNLYGLKQASYNWYEKLKKGLTDRGFTPSTTDPCLYLKRGMIVLTYVDDCIIVGNSMDEIDDFVASMSNTKPHEFQGNKITKPENFILTDEGNIDKFLGIDIKNHNDGSFEMSQPHLIDRTLKYVIESASFPNAHVNAKLTPAAEKVLNKDADGLPRKNDWKYRTAVGMLTYLQGNTRPDISMPVHQTARFCEKPMRSHEKAITRICRYLLHSKDRGIVFKPDVSKGLECYVDADFAGGWCQSDPHDASNIYSRTGFVIKYANCPIFWASKLQTEIALSTAESEYIALSTALREVIPLMRLLKEIHNIFTMLTKPPTFHCTVWEDNQSCIAMATTQKFTPRTKHIALKYHHFRNFVESKEIAIQYVRTEDQQADILTKPVKPELFFPIRKMLMGW